MGALVEDTTDIAGLEKSIGHGEVEDDLEEGHEEERLTNHSRVDPKEDGEGGGLESKVRGDKEGKSPRGISSSIRRPGADGVGRLSSGGHQGSGGREQADGRHDDSLQQG